MKKNLSIIIAILFPIVLVGIVTLAVYIPQSNLHPMYDFVFVNQSYTYPASPEVAVSYSVENGKIVEHGQYTEEDRLKGVPYYTGITGDLYLYSVSTDTFKRVTYAEVKDLMVTNSMISPDGFTFTQRGYSGDFFFGGTSRSGWILQKDGKAKRTKIPDEMYYAQLVGWVLK